jgi:CRISPR-associated protein Csh1
MIKEITQFVKTLPPEAFTKNVKLKEGIYLFLDVEDADGILGLKNTDSSGKLLNTDIQTYTMKSEDSSFFQKCLHIQFNSIPVSPQKIFNPNKKIYNSSCSPFALAFTKKHYTKYKNDKELLQSELKDQYFKSAERYLTQDYQKPWFKHFRDFLVLNLFDFLATLSEYQDAKDSYLINIYFKKAKMADFSSTLLPICRNRYLIK